MRAGMVDRRQPLPSRAPPAQEEAADALQHPRDRRDQPGRRPRPRAAASGPVRPFDPLRPADPWRPARDHRLLPRPQGPRSRARQGRAPRPARRDDLRVHAGDDRAPLRRGSRVGAARRPRRDGLARHPAGEDDRGDRPEAAGRVHRRREADDRDARSRARGRRPPRRPEPQARGAVDHQAPRRARPARPLRQRGALHAHPVRADGLDEDRVRRDDRRGAVLRRVGNRSRRRPRRTRPASRPRWWARSGWRARWCRSKRWNRVR